MKTRITTIFLIILITLTTITPTASAQRIDFMDIGGHWVRSMLVNLAATMQRWGKDDINIFQGEIIYGNRFFRPERHMTRAEFATMLVNLFDLHDEFAENRFHDVCPGAWYTNPIASATAAGMIHGINNEGTLFAPSQPITRQETFVMFARLCLSFPFFYPVCEDEWEDTLVEFIDVDNVASWALESAVFLVYHNIITGIAGGEYRFFEAQHNLTRAQAATIIARSAEVIRLRQWEYNRPEPPPTREPDWIDLLPDVTVDELLALIERAQPYMELAEKFWTLSNVSRMAILRAHSRAVETAAIEDPSQWSINYRYHNLTEAINNLLVWDKTVLRQTINDALAYRINIRYFTPESYVKFNEGIQQLLSVNRNVRCDLTQEYIDAAIEAFHELLRNLERSQKCELRAVLDAAAEVARPRFMYEAESYMEFTRTRSAVYTVYRWPATVEEISAAIDTMLAAIDALIVLPKEEFLQYVITLGEINVLLSYRFTPESGARILAALEVAQDLRDRGDGTFEEHRDVAQDLWDAVFAREFLPRWMLPVFMNLAASLARNADFTWESRQALHPAIEAARDALADEDTTEEVFQEVMDALLAAIDALVLAMSV